MRYQRTAATLAALALGVGTAAACGDSADDSNDGRLTAEGGGSETLPPDPGPDATQTDHTATTGTGATP